MMKTISLSDAMVVVLLYVVDTIRSLVTVGGAQISKYSSKVTSSGTVTSGQLFKLVFMWPFVLQGESESVVSPRPPWPIASNVSLYLLATYRRRC